MLNDDHRENLKARADAVASSVHRAWMHFNVIRGMVLAAERRPEAPLTNPIGFYSIYRAAFDALYIAIGLVTDKRSDVESLHTLVQMARRYPTERSIVAHIESVLASTQSRDELPLRKLRRWRDKHTAHRTAEASTPRFYTENRMELNEIEEAITTLDTALSEISYSLLGFRYENRPSTDEIAESCATLLAGDAA